MTSVSIICVRTVSAKRRKPEAIRDAGVMALVAELNAEPGEHEFFFQFKSSTGEDLAPPTPKGKFKVGDVGLGEVVAELRNFPITKTGFLSVQIVIDGNIAGQRDLLIRKEGE